MSYIRHDCDKSWIVKIKAKDKHKDSRQELYRPVRGGLYMPEQVALHSEVVFVSHISLCIYLAARKSPCPRGQVARIS